MIYNSQKQLLQCENDLFDLALLGLLEIEGRALALEDKRLRESGEYETIPAPPKSELQKIEKMIKKQETKNRIEKILKGIAPVITKFSVFFMVFWIGTGAVFITSAEARETLYRLIVEQYEKYSVIEPNWSHLNQIENYQEYADAGMMLIPTYVPDVLSFTEIESGRYFNNVYYEGREEKELFLDFSQITPSGNGELQIDTENADAIENIMIGESLGMLVQKDQTTQIVWSIGGKVFMVLTNLNREEAVQFVQAMQLL